MAGVRGTAHEVLLVGADSGVVDTNKKTASPGPIAFARSLPLEKAIAGSTILAYSMNEEPLTRDHGYPLRAVVGGWFGMAWVKWITHIIMVEQPFLGYWQARDYFRWERSLGEPRLVPLAEMEVKAQIAHPVQGAHLVADQPYRIFGAAWSGEAAIRQVQVCTGDGKGWREGRLLETERSFACACGSACGHLNKWDDTSCDVARSMRRGACSRTCSVPTARATPRIGSFRWRLRSFPNHRPTRKNS
jgi:hypothetical protein